MFVLHQKNLIHTGFLLAIAGLVMEWPRYTMGRDDVVPSMPSPGTRTSDKTNTKQRRRSHGKMQASEPAGTFVADEEQVEKGYESPSIPYNDNAKAAAEPGFAQEEESMSDSESGAVLQGLPMPGSVQYRDEEDYSSSSSYPSSRSGSYSSGSSYAHSPSSPRANFDEDDYSSETNESGRRDHVVSPRHRAKHVATSTSPYRKKKHAHDRRTGHHHGRRTYRNVVLGSGSSSEDSSLDHFY